MEARENLLREAENVLQQIMDSGVAEDSIAEQMQRFKAGFAFTRLARPCTPGDGIKRIPVEDRPRLISVFHRAMGVGRVTKFVPASGAATRMFKSLLALYGRGDQEDCLQGEDADSLFGKVFFASLDKFAFYGELADVMDNNGVSLAHCLANADYKTILRYTLKPEGLNYGQLPKGLIPFHKYKKVSRTPFAEHVAEAVEYATDNQGKARIHFTVGPEHRQAIEKHVSRILTSYPDIRFEVSYSEQKTQTNTIAVDLSNEGFRSRDGKLLFRPAGHGALLVNLNELQADLVFLKNIDNVVPDRLKGDTFEFKKVLGGLLVELQNKTFDYVRLLKRSLPDGKMLSAMAEFAVSDLSIVLPENYAHMTGEEKAEFFSVMFNRPMRICGMVKNQGDPGGGPFWVYGTNGLATPQIVEKSQVDLDDSSQAACLASATHFNPVDIVCGVRDSEGRPFDLMERIDEETGFISIKSKDGQELKALELPGLWNGSMADWITVFVEVPLSTFSPVKTVNDLLKPEHQP